MRSSILTYLLISNRVTPIHDFFDSIFNLIISNRSLVYLESRALGTLWCADFSVSRCSEHWKCGFESSLSFWDSFWKLWLFFLSVLFEEFIRPNNVPFQRLFGIKCHLISSSVFKETVFLSFILNLSAFCRFECNEDISF